MRISSYFLAIIGREGQCEGDLAGEAILKGRGPDDTITSVRCGSMDGLWLTSPATGITASSASADVVIVVHGELYPAPSQGALQRCLDAYLEKGMGFVSDLHGSFALAVVDKRAGRVFFATDRVNSRKLFYGEYDGLAYVSTMGAFHLHPRSGTPDPAGLAHCLVNGVPLGGLTPFEGVRVLDRASVHEIQRHGVHSELYWHYRPEPTEGTSAESFRTDLSDAILTAVERRLPDTGGISLSLSGGYDSTAVLGALGVVGANDVRCYTYKKTTEGSRSDASVASRMAAIAGYDYTEIEAYGDDVSTVIAENVRRGHGLTRLVVETDTWRTLRELLAPEQPTTFWVADECLGMNPPRVLLDDSDVLSSLAFGDFSSLGSLKGLFPRPVASLLAEALRADLDSMIERNQAIRDPYLLRDYLYLDQRLPRLLSWREAFADSCGEVRNPLLDSDVLELRQRFPKPLTLGKQFFKDTATEMFPDLFGVQRAVAGSWHAGRWCRDVVLTHSDVLSRMVRTTSSPLDSYLPPEGILGLIDKENGRSGGLRRVARRARAAKGKVRKRIRAIGSPDSQGLRPQIPSVDPAVFILRAITLRELYRNRGGR